MITRRYSTIKQPDTHSDHGVRSPAQPDRPPRYHRSYSEQLSSTPVQRPKGLPGEKQNDPPSKQANKAIKREDSPSRQLKDTLYTHLKYEPRKPVKATRGKHLRLLCLDGGGVRGLSSLITLRYLMKSMDPKNPPKPCEVFDMIGGTSTGGLIAIMLGRLEMDVETCIAVYTKLSSAVFNIPWYWRVVYFISSMLHLFNNKLPTYFDSEKLETILQEVVKEQGLRRHETLRDQRERCCRVFVCATNKDTSSIDVLTSYWSQGSPEFMPEVHIWEAARATSAAPTFFDAIQLGPSGQVFLDGGTGANNPIDNLWEEAENHWSASPLSDQVQCVVSIGTGALRTVPFAPGLSGLFKALLEICTKATISAENFQLHRSELCSDRLFRFNVTNGLEDIGIGEHKKQSLLTSATESYLRSDDVRQRVGLCARKLTINWPQDRKIYPEPIGKRQPTRTKRKASFWKRCQKWLFAALPFILTFAGTLQSDETIDFLNRAISQYTSWYDLDHSVPILAIMGKTAVGKSTFISPLGGRHYRYGYPPGVERSLEPGTMRVGICKAIVDNRPIYLMDAPGFDDTYKNDTMIYRSIMDELVSSGFMILMDIVSLVQAGNISDISNLYVAFPNIILATTRWEKGTDKAEQRDFERQLKEKYWKSLIMLGSRVEQHHRTNESARLLIRIILDRNPVELLAQREVVNEGRSFENTTIGKAVNGGGEEKQWQCLSGERQDCEGYATGNAGTTFGEAAMADIISILLNSLVVGIGLMIPSAILNRR